MAKKKATKRVQFEFTVESVERLERLIDTTDSVSRAEVVRKALKLYDYIVDKTKDGYVMGFQKDEKFTPVISL